MFRLFGGGKKSENKFKTLLDEFESMYDIDEIIEFISENNELKLEKNVLERIPFPYFKNFNLYTEFNTETISNMDNKNLCMVNYEKYIKEMRYFFLFWLALLIVTEFCILIAG